MPTLSSLRRVPSSGRRLLATAGLASLAVVAATFGGTAMSSSAKTAPNHPNPRAAGHLVGGHTGSLVLADPPAPEVPAHPSPDVAPVTKVPEPPPAPVTPPPTPVTPPPSAPPPKPKPKPKPVTPVVSLAADHTTVAPGDKVSLTATVRKPNGTAVGSAVAVLQGTVGSAWVTIAKARTAANGVVTWSVNLAAARRYRVSTPTVTASGATVYNRAASKAVLVKTLDLGAQIVAYTAKFAGRPYVFGAAGPRTFDCSGLVLYVYKHVVGMDLPHHAADQAHFGKRITRSQAKPGDLIFFFTSSGYVHHVAIYTGNGMMWEAPHTGSFVRHVKIPGNQSFMFRRLINH